MTDPTLLDTPMVTRGVGRYGGRAEVLRATRGRGDVANATSSFIGFRVFLRVRDPAVRVTAPVVIPVVIRGGSWSSEVTTSVTEFERTSDTKGHSLGFRVFRRVREPTK